MKKWAHKSRTQSAGVCFMVWGARAASGGACLPFCLSACLPACCAPRGCTRVSRVCVASMFSPPFLFPSLPLPPQRPRFLLFALRFSLASWSCVLPAHLRYFRPCPLPSNANTPPTSSAGHCADLSGAPAAKPARGGGGGKKTRDQQNRLVTEQLVRRAREVHAGSVHGHGAATSPFKRFGGGAKGSPFADRSSEWLSPPPQPPQPRAAPPREQLVAEAPAVGKGAPTGEIARGAGQGECARTTSFMIHSQRREALSSAAAARYNSFLQAACPYHDAVAEMLSHVRQSVPPGPLGVQAPLHTSAARVPRRVRERAAKALRWVFVREAHALLFAASLADPSRRWLVLGARAHDMVCVRS